MDTMNLSFIQDENAVEAIDGITYEFPYTMHQRDLSNFVVPWHWHEELEFDYVYKGSITVETVNHTYTMRQGEAYFLNTNIMNTKRKTPESSMTVEQAHLFHPILLTGYYRSIFETKYLNPVLKDQSIEVLIIKESTKSGKEFIKILHQLAQINQEENREFEIRSLLSKAFLVLIEEIKFQKSHQSIPSLYSHERTKQMLSFIHQHYAEKISLQDLSDHAGLSTKECIRLFKNTFHQTPMDYLISYRIEQAKDLLKNTEEPVTNIAFMTGFQNSAYFSKTFKKYTDLTPKQYRNLSLQSH